jgi:hypothetical protein
MSGIENAILRGEWVEQGITSWNKLLRFVFGKINKEKNKYQGKAGLERAIQLLKDFKKKFGKMPASNSKGIYTIYNNAHDGIWEDFGINNWYDLLKTTFGRINKEKNKYIGKKGLERAKKELIQYKKRFGKKPVSKSKGMNTIYTYARLGKWKKFGIFSWSDLLEKTFK